MHYVCGISYHSQLKAISVKQRFIHESLHSMPVPHYLFLRLRLPFFIFKQQEHI